MGCRRIQPVARTRRAESSCAPMGALATKPPADAGELAQRASALTGRTIEEVAAEQGTSIALGVHTKGKVGALVEQVLGATGGSLAKHDFPHLGIELKTIPLRDVTPRESTYVCTVPIADADRAEWSTSWARAKLSHVLWMPFDAESRTFGAPLFWRPTEEQDAILGGDFEEAMGTIALGGIEGLSARLGRWMQVRPKAKDGSARVLTHGRENEIIATIPRGFYLRARFTGAILRDPAALP
jgi:DNA mismatch repair protein MutH